MSRVTKSFGAKAAKSQSARDLVSSRIVPLRPWRMLTIYSDRTKRRECRWALPEFRFVPPGRIRTLHVQYRTARRTRSAQVPPGGFEHYMFSTGPRVVLAALRATCSSFLILPAMLRVAWVSFRSAQVPPGGFEPPTVSLRASCSTN